MRAPEQHKLSGTRLSQFRVSQLILAGKIRSTLGNKEPGPCSTTRMVGGIWVLRPELILSNQQSEVAFAIRERSSSQFSRCTGDILAKGSVVDSSAICRGHNSQAHFDNRTQSWVVNRQSATFQNL